MARGATRPNQPVTSCNISLVVPTYNAACTIAATLASVQAQGEALIHVAAIVIADDASTDQTFAEVERSWLRDVPLKYSRSDENVGERRTTNRVFSDLRNADWVVILHADDIAKPHWLGILLSVMESAAPDVATVCSSWDNLYSDQSVILGEDDENRMIEVIDGTRESARNTLMRGCWWHLSGCAIRVRAFEDIGGFDPEMPQLGDWDWLLRCLLKGWKVVYVPRTLIQYRVHSSSVSSKSFDTNRDIRESLVLIGRYGSLLTWGELLRFHLSRLRYLGRRMARATLTGDARRIIGVLSCMRSTLESLTRSMWGRRF